MFNSCAAMTTPAKDPDLVNKVTLLQKVFFLLLYKDIAPKAIHTKSCILLCYSFKDNPASHKNKAGFLSKKTSGDQTTLK
jgi:hypothetical protein